MAVVTIHEAQAKLAELIHRLGPADEVVITENNEPVARLFADVSKREPEAAATWNDARHGLARRPRFRRPS